MGKIAKLAIMAIGLSFALAGVVKIRRMVDTTVPVPTRIAGEEGDPPGRPTGRPRVSHQPTILRAKPSGAQRDDSSPPYWESAVPSPVQPLRDHDVFPIEPAIPFHAPDGPTSLAPSRELYEHPSDGLEYSIPNILSDRLGQRTERAKYPILNSLPNNAGLVGPSIPNALSASGPGLVAPSRRKEPIQGWPTDPSTDVGTWRTSGNDSLWEISRVRYGTGEYYRALFALNRIRIHRPDRLEAGLILETPSVDVLRAKFPELCPIPARDGS